MNCALAVYYLLYLAGHDASCPAIITVYFTESEITKKDTANITITSSGGG